MIRTKILLFFFLLSGPVFSQCVDAEIVFESPNACAGGPEDILWSLYAGDFALYEDVFHYFPINPDPMIEEVCLPEGEYTLVACGYPYMIEANFSGELRLNGVAMPALDGPNYVDGCFSCTMVLAVPCYGDLNFDGAIAVSDMLVVLSEFGCTTDCTADLDNDGVVGISDILDFLAVLGTSCD